MTGLARHLRSNAVAYVALFVALGGTGYAATNLPAGSVGSRQIRNHAIQPVKLDSRYIGGNVRLWASVSASGKVVAGGRGVTVQGPGGGAGNGVFALNPSRNSRLALPWRCAVVASVDDSSATPGFANGEVGVFPRDRGMPWQVVVETYNSQGIATSLPFDVALIC